MTDVAVNIFAIILSIAVLSRIVADNPLFRAAQYIFVGVSLGLAFVVAFHQVLKPTALALMSGSTDSLLLYGIPVLLGLFLIPRAVGGQELSWLANIPLALIFGVGSALAISGAILGTLLPQILLTAQPLSADPMLALGSLVLTIATILVLTRFYYSVPQQAGGKRMLALVGAIGHWILMIAFGFFFAGALQTYLSALTERLLFILGFFGLAG
ncbi:MAG: hypothetical protein Fur005_04720 [Roseiflexaceae bacterium]